MDSPVAHHARERVFENESPVSVVDKLDKAPFHHLIPEDDISQEGHLVGTQLRHRVGIQLITDGCINGLDDHINKRVEILLSCLSQLFVLDNHLFHIDSS